MKTIVVYIADRLICCVTFQKNLVHINGIYQKVKLSSLNKCQIMSVLQKAKQMSLVMRKPDFCLCENKDAHQLRGNREADQRLCFRYTDSTIPLLSKSEISSL